MEYAPAEVADQAAVGITGRVLALVEVSIVFVLLHVSFRSFKHFTAPGRLERAWGINFSPGVLMILFTVVLVYAHRRRLKDYGLTLEGWPSHVSLGIVWGTLPIIAAALVMMLTPIRFDAVQVPNRLRGSVAGLGYVILTVLLLLNLRREGSRLRRIPPAWSAAFLVALLVGLPIGAWRLHRSPVHAALTVLWLFVGAGFGEEIFFRGYLQSRVNHAFGRPFRLLGMEFGVGLLVSAFFFGVIHALNTFDYIGGRYEIAWWHFALGFGAGLFHGCFREKTGSVLPGAVAHGVGDILARIPNLLR